MNESIPARRRAAIPEWMESADVAIGGNGRMSRPALIRRPIDVAQLNSLITKSIRAEARGQAGRSEGEELEVSRPGCTKRHPRGVLCKQRNYQIQPLIRTIMKNKIVYVIFSRTIVKLTFSCVKTWLGESLKSPITQIVASETKRRMLGSNGRAFSPSSITRPSAAIRNHRRSLTSS